MPQYITTAGDTVDFIAWKYYGTQQGQVLEKLLNANPKLADYGPVLPAGVVVEMPSIGSSLSQAKGVKLWD